MQIKRYSFLVILLLFSMFGCREKETFSLTDDDLKMVDVTVDVFTINGAVRDVQPPETKDSLTLVYFNQLYQIHGIDSVWLASQQSRLIQDPIRMDSVYNRAKAALQMLKKSDNQIKHNMKD